VYVHPRATPPRPRNARLLLRDGQALAAMESDVKSGGSRAVVRGGEGNAWRRLMNLVMQLRKV
jgi:hypothetical protein